jgi:hypothetical protein
MTSFIVRDEDAIENQTIGDQAVNCSSEASFHALSLFAGSEVVFRRTNSLPGETLFIESDFTMQTSGDLPTLSTNLITKAFGSASVSFQLQSDIPFRYSIAASGQNPPVVPLLGGIIIRTASSSPILAMDWGSAAGNSLPQEHQGNLAAGIYQVEFWDIAQSQGETAPGFQNPIGGTAGTTLSLAIIPDSSTPAPAPLLRMRAVGSEMVQLEMSGLQPGTFYFIRRSDGLVPEPWSIFANFIAGGTDATITDTVGPNLQGMFYRLQY